MSHYRRHRHPTRQQNNVGFTDDAYKTEGMDKKDAEKRAWKAVGRELGQRRHRIRARRDRLPDLAGDNGHAAP